MRTQTGDVITVSPPAAGSNLLSMLWLNKSPTSRAVELTPEEAVELGRQLITAVRGRRMIVVADADVATAETA